LEVGVPRINQQQLLKSFTVAELIPLQWPQNKLPIVISLSGHNQHFGPVDRPETFLGIYHDRTEWLSAYAFLGRRGGQIRLNGYIHLHDR
jgi:hypothetical protein